MNSEAIMHEFVSRPKINRLPLPPEHSISYENLIDGNTVKWSLATVILLFFVFIVYQYGSLLVKTSPSSVDDARLLEVINSSIDIAKPSDSTLYFRDTDGVIVGNMVRITSESDNTIPDKVYNNGNTTTESELLSILSKY